MQSSLQTHQVATLDELRSELESFQRPMTAAELLDFTYRMQLAPRQWRDYLAFNPHRYCCQTIYESQHFEINIISWQSV